MFGGYRVEGVLGRGGMGVVYRAVRVATGQRVALKTVRSETVSKLASIRREIEAMSQIEHPGVARILDHGVEKGVPWYAMELLEGFTLRDHIRARFEDEPRRKTVTTHRGPAVRLDLEATAPAPELGMDFAQRVLQAQEPPRWTAAPVLQTVLDTFLGICESLAALHLRGIIHRDLKPENVFVEGDRIVLVDFGIAVRFGDSREYEIDGQGFAGTPEYAAPEQILDRNIDARADLYAIGCMLYECLTGRPPFIGTDVSEVVSLHLAATPALPSALVAGVPPSLEALVMRLLAKRPSDRIGFANDLGMSLIAEGARRRQREDRPTSVPSSSYVYRPEFVGRTAVMRRLEGMMRGNAATERRALIRGESGVGKTRILRELAARAVQSRTVVVIAQCAGVGSSSGAAEGAFTAPLHPFRAFLLRVADLCRERGKDEARRLLGSNGRLLLAFEPLLGEWVASSPGSLPEKTETTLTPDMARARLFGALRDTFYAYAGGRPMLILIDDLQWADELTVGFLASFQSLDLDAHRTSVVCTYRADESVEHLRALETQPGVALLSLDRLAPSAVGDMLRGMLALPVAPPAFTEFMMRQSEGNPFFVAEYLRAAIDHGLLQRDSAGRWQLQIDDGKEDLTASWMPTPPSIRDLMERRIAQLEAPAQTLLSAAAVLEREFDADLLVELAGVTDREALQTLRRREILEEGNAGLLRFAHDRIRQLAYRRIGASDLCTWHHRAAQALESFHGSGPGRTLALPAIALHWQRAGVHDRAAEYYTMVGDLARASYAHGEALDAYRSAAHAARALMAAPAADPNDAWSNALRQILEREADVLTVLGRPEQARHVLEEATRAMAAGHPVWSARLLWKTARTLEIAHRHHEALAAYDQAEVVLGSEPSRAAVTPSLPSRWPLAASDESESSWWHQWVQLQVERVWVHYWLADVEAMTMRVERVRSIVEARGTAPQRARFFQALTHANLRRERYVVSMQTVELARSSLAAAEEADDDSLVAYAQFVLAFQLLFSGAVRTAAPVMRAALAGAETTGDVALQTRCETYLTVLGRLIGDLDMARQHARRALELAGRLGMQDYLGAAYANLGWLAWREGRTDDAVRETTAALANWSELAQRYPYPFQWLARLHGMAERLAAGAVGDAIEHARVVLEQVQHRLPDVISLPLIEAVAAWERGDAEIAAERVRSSLAGAQSAKYL